MPERSKFHEDQPSECWHANCVAVEGRGLLILGPSGSGKSSLTLELMALGARLVADDRVILCKHAGRIRAQAPDTLRGLVEARGVGILKSEYLMQVYVDAIVDMQKTEHDRLPELRTIEILGQPIPCYYKCESPSLPAALLQLLKAGRHA
ncbi:MAG: HPr kinase/phosphatase C-terminal domain-containing protein [Paracoccaceae bacterium]|nr:HPr kinase/phosphatase C-terminal domain-containing protein [Paracoccaceae bacterium]MDG2258674.1 HPr kinase/phosphatase C-terminal domain-containing protein [Paracoccaceae bacterium]